MRASSEVRGSWDATSMRRPVAGWSNAIRAACRNWRSSPSSLPALRAVERVADDGQADGGEVDADLVACGPSRAAGQQAVLGQGLGQLEVRDRVGARRALDGHPAGVAGVAAERRLHRATP